MATATVPTPTPTRPKLDKPNVPKFEVDPEVERHVKLRAEFQGKARKILATLNERYEANRRRTDEEVARLRDREMQRAQAVMKSDRAQAEAILAGIDYVRP